MPRKTTQAAPSTKPKRNLQEANARDTAINELLNILTAKEEKSFADTFASDTVDYKYSADERLKAAELILKIRPTSHRSRIVIDKEDKK